MTLRCFISGPITGIDQLNEPAFTDAAETLARKGFTPVNPHSICSHLPADSEHADYMEICLLRLAESDAIYMLPNWEHSKGAKQEFDSAYKRRLPIWFAPTASAPPTDSRSLQSAAMRDL